MQKHRVFISSVLFLLGIAMIVIGVLNGEMSDVLEKSIRICLECVGIG